LIISHDDFNHAFKRPCVVPITSTGNFDRDRGFVISLMGAGTQTQGVLVCSQYRTLDLKARRGRRIETVPEDIVEQALDLVRATLE
jgi:mRNA interferase ChpB